jgi:hypothetical protein
MPSSFSLVSVCLFQEFLLSSSNSIECSVIEILQSLLHMTIYCQDTSYVTFKGISSKNTVWSYQMWITPVLNTLFHFWIALFTIVWKLHLYVFQGSLPMLNRQHYQDKLGRNGWLRNCSMVNTGYMWANKLLAFLL